jgi:protein involved in polysaccharide export with SLBB domain
MKKIFLLNVFLFLMVSCAHMEQENQQEYPPEPVLMDLEQSEQKLNELLEKHKKLEAEAEERNAAGQVEETKAPPPYRLHVGDVLEISILDEPEMTREVTVISDGTISYLLVGRVNALGRTIDELKNTLTEKLKEFFVSPYVSILTKEVYADISTSNTVSLLGALGRPGNYQLKSKERLLDAIAEAGGLLYTQTEFGSRTTANLKASYISRNNKKLDVDFFKLLQQGDMTQNILLEPGDFVYIANAEDENIIVMGEVSKPRIIPYTRNISLIEALSMCNGFTREAYQSRVVIIRPQKDDKTKFLEVNVNDLLLGREVSNITLKGGDIVFVPEQGISEYSRYANFITDMMEVVLKGYQVREAILFPKLNRKTPSD